VTREFHRSQAGAARELQHVARGPEAVELPANHFDLGEPATVPLGAAVVAALAEKPLVVLPARVL
jgi:hypothetical protein